MVKFKLFIWACLLFLCAQGVDARAGESLNYDQYYNNAASNAALYKASVIDIEEFVKLREMNEVIIIDLRDARDYEAIHIKGAINLTANQITEEYLNKYIGDKNKTIIIYCDDSLNAIPYLSRTISLTAICFPQLKMHGYHNIKVLDTSSTRVVKNGKIKSAYLSQDEFASKIKKIDFEYDKSKLQNAGDVSKNLARMLFE